MTMTGPHTGHDHRGCWFSRWATSLHSRYWPEMRLAISRPDNHQLRLSAIQVRHASRGQGLGHMVLTEITTTADRHHHLVTCSPTAEYGATLNRLVAWYAQFGFIPNNSENHRDDVKESMYRLPGTTQNVTPEKQGPFRLVHVGNLELEVPQEVSHRWLDESAARLLAAMAALGLGVRVDWWHRVRRGAVRLFLTEPDGRPCGAVLVGAQSGRVLRGHLRLPGMTVERAEFSGDFHWRRVLGEHSTFLRMNSRSSTSRGLGEPES